MALQLTLVTLSWAVGVSALAVVAQIWRRGRLRDRWVLASLVGLTSLYAFGYGIELVGESVAWILATFTVQYLAIAFFPTLLLWLAAIHEGGAWARQRWWKVLAVGVSVATLLVVATNPLHDLFHANPVLDTSGPFTVIGFERGPAYLAFHVYAAVGVLVANLLFLRAWLSRSRSRRAQSAMLFFASLVPWLGNLVNQARVLPINVDVMPFSLFVTCVLAYIGVVRLGLADLAPIARDLVFERMGDAALVLDTEGRVIDQNVAAVRLLGQLTEPGAATLGPLLSDVQPELAEAATAVVATAGEEGGSLRDTLRDEPPEVSLRGRSYHVRAVELRDRRRQFRGRVLVLRDITRYVEMEAVLRSLATIDELTGIPNRRHFLELTARGLAQAKRHRRPVAMVIFDLDRFKLVNDTYGHQAGDALLRAIAHAAAAGVRTGDVIGRFGGEEFAVFLADADRAGAAAFAERLRAAIAGARVEWRGRTLRATASVGVVTVTGDAAPTLDQLIAAADRAQYGAKARGGDAVEVTHMAPAVGA